MLWMKRLKLKKILFFIHDLGPGGAEKVLVNLVNNMDQTKFDITVMTLFDVGVNKKFLKKNIRYLSCFKKVIRGNSHLMKLFSPEYLHRKFIKERYDIEVAYLEGPCARIISGCPYKDTKLAAWIHTEYHNRNRLAESFRSFREAEECYNCFHKIVCVSQTAQKSFSSLLNLNVPGRVLYNVNDYPGIIQASKEKIEDDLFSDKTFNMIAVGKIQPSKGFERLLKIRQHTSISQINSKLDEQIKIYQEKIQTSKTIKDEDILKFANKKRIPVIPRGAATNHAGGCNPVKGGIILHFSNILISTFFYFLKN